MIKRILAFVAGMSMLIGSAGVQAQACTTLPYTLTNGTTADASQVMANYNYLINCFTNWNTTGLGVFTSPGVALDVQKSSSSGTVQTRVKNTSNTANSNAAISVETGGTSAGDPYFLVYNGTAAWSFGMDQSDSSKFKLSQSTSLGTNDYWTVDTSGNGYIASKLGINVAPPVYTLDVAASGSSQNTFQFVTDASAPATTFLGALHHKATSGDNQFALFGTEASFTERGSISYNRAGGVLAYNTTSDYRAKDTFGLFHGAGALIDAIPVYLGQMKGAIGKRPMVIAHEVQKVAPWAVTGEKDAIDKDGKPLMQQLSQGALVELMLAEIQDLRMRLARLEGPDRR